MKQILLFAICVMVSFFANAKKRPYAGHVYKHTKQEIVSCADLDSGLTDKKFFTHHARGWNKNLDSVALVTNGEITSEGVYIPVVGGEKKFLHYVDVNDMKEIFSLSRVVSSKNITTVMTSAWIFEEPGYIFFERRLRKIKIPEKKDSVSESFLAESIGEFYKIPELNTILFLFCGDICLNPNVLPIFLQPEKVEKMEENRPSKEVVRENVEDVENIEDDNQTVIVKKETIVIESQNPAYSGVSYGASSYLSFGLGVGLYCGVSSTYGISYPFNYGYQYPPCYYSACSNGSYSPSSTTVNNNFYNTYVASTTTRDHGVTQNSPGVNGGIHGVTPNGHSNGGGHNITPGGNNNSGSHSGLPNGSADGGNHGISPKPGRTNRSLASNSNQRHYASNERHGLGRALFGPSRSHGDYVHSNQRSQGRNYGGGQPQNYSNNGRSFAGGGNGGQRQQPVMMQPQNRGGGGGVQRMSAPAPQSRGGNYGGGGRR